MFGKMIGLKEYLESLIKRELSIEEYKEWEQDIQNALDKEPKVVSKIKAKKLPVRERE